MVDYYWSSEVEAAHHDSLLDLIEGAFAGDAREFFAEKPKASDLAAMFGGCAIGIFATAGDDLVAFARVMSDHCMCSWIAELCVHPDWRGRDIGSELVSRIRERFARTAIYINVPAAGLDFIRKTGMLYKPKLVASGVRADPRLREASFPVPEGIRIVRDVSMLTAEAMAGVCESVGFTIRNVTAEEVLLRCWRQEHIHSDLAFADDRLVGLVRVFSDGVRSSWLSEICVHPDWQRKGVGRALLASVRARFAHTALFTGAFAETLEFFRPFIPAAPGWLGCSLKSVRT
ncbi:MAG: GNAT family N-acetyltransferase [Bacteroidales bacterium]